MLSEEMFLETVDQVVNNLAKHTEEINPSMCVIAWEDGGYTTAITVFDREDFVASKGQLVATAGVAVARLGLRAVAAILVGLVDMTNSEGRQQEGALVVASTLDQHRRCVFLAANLDENDELLSYGAPQVADSCTTPLLDTFWESYSHERLRCSPDVKNQLRAAAWERRN